MAIIGFLNGYYRTGTTIVWWILQQSNPDIPVLYEPHSIGLYRGLLKTTDGSRVDRTHNLPIYKPYFMIPKELREEYIRNAVPKSVYTKDELLDAIKTVEMFDRAEQKFAIQSNQLHLILNDICEYFDCNYVHMMRDPAEVLFSHADHTSRLRQAIHRFSIAFTPNLMIWKWLHHGYGGKFDLRNTREVAKKLGWLSGSKDLLEDFIRLYTHYNYYVFSNLSRRGKFVRFEDLIKKPTLFRKMANWIGLKLEKQYLDILDPDKAFRCPKNLREKVRKRVRGEIKRMLEEMGYAF